MISQCTQLAQVSSCSSSSSALVEPTLELLRKLDVAILNDDLMLLSISANSTLGLKEVHLGASTHSLPLYPPNLIFFMRSTKWHVELCSLMVIPKFFSRSEEILFLVN
ncbi:hypothetical protein OPV22_011847 [Ensete ventricosum]|uniref:Uncharacterized protein n=1 Tax=Ensete ventricosum TaxID=4639 RepID=A0AAV8PYI3_ENSVE|nr:hypothetical protein OPV22_011847 [Ensete ventricosum]